MAYSDLRFEKHGHVALATLDRPDKLNALSRALQRDILNACDEVNTDDEIRALVFTGAGRGFCSGVDLTGGARAAAAAAATAGQADQAEATAATRQPRALSQGSQMDEFGWVGRQALTVYGCEKPTIAAVNGVAAGAGMSLALACDMRVGGPSARFRTVFLERNLSPDSGMSWFLPRIVGYSRAVDLIFTSRDVAADESHRIGLLDRLVPTDDEVVSAALELAEQIASLPPLAMRSAKRVVQHNTEVDLREGLRYEMFGLSFARKATNDARESRQAFVEKRKGIFTGT